jgi:hypothetical protein
MQMKRFLLTATAILAVVVVATAQKISTIEHEGKKLMVADMTFMGTIQWGGYEQIGEAAQSEENGKANTLVIVKMVGANKGFEGKPYAAKVCDTLNAGGFSDWYLPAKNESDIIHANFPQLKLDEKMTLWTSTEANGTQAVSKYLYSGTFYNVQKVDSYHFVCVRKPD